MTQCLQERGCLARSQGIEQDTIPHYGVLPGEGRPGSKDMIIGVWECFLALCWDRSSQPHRTPALFGVVSPRSPASHNKMSQSQSRHWKCSLLGVLAPRDKQSMGLCAWLLCLLFLSREILEHSLSATQTLLPHATFLSAEVASTQQPSPFP